MKNVTRLMKATLTICLSLLFASQTQAQVQYKSTDVMLQGFYWNSQTSTNWGALEAQATELANSFDMIWLPPSAAAEGGGALNVGYHPVQWSNQNSAWGEKAELKSLINTLHEKDVKVIADVVINHRAGTDWCTFPADNYGTGYTTYQFTNEHICKDDEAKQGGGNTSGVYPTGGYDYKYNVSGDYWGGYAAARDLDHSSDYVRNAIKEYMKFLKNEIGYDGWRYDLVKGYDPKYTKEYNQAADAYFSVGEYWDANYDMVAAWIDGTGKTSAAFDFPGKYAALNGGLASNDYSKMIWSGAPAGLIHSVYDCNAVTFVDNHDTYREDHSKYTGNVPQAYAFILSTKGVPCVFYPHWTAHKAAIKAMIEARKSVGIHNQSPTTAVNNGSYYESTATGLCGSLICRIGSWSGSPSGYTMACNGDGWAFYTKSNGSDCNPDNPDNPGTEIGTATIKVKAPSTWSSVSIWAWDKNSVLETNYTGGSWPGKAMTKGDDGYYSITLTGITTSLMGVVINNGGNKEQSIDLTATGDVCWQIGSSFTTETDGTKKYATTVDSSCSGGTDPDPEPESITVKAKPGSVLGSDVYVYYWSGAVNNGWPGVKMTLDANGYHTYTISDLASVNVIFSNGTKQTADITGITSDSCFEILSTTEQNTGGTTVQKYSEITCPGGTNIDDVDDVEFKIYPTIVTDRLTIDTNKDINNVAIYSMSSGLVGTTSEKDVYVGDLPQGFYFVKVIFEDGTTQSGKFIKK